MDEAIQTINRLFLAVDNRDWDSLKYLMNDTLYLDYSSMTGEKADTLPLKQVLESWKMTLPGFDKTHHQLGNYLVEVNSNSTKVFCYGTASHYLKNETGNNIWTVVGTYDFELNADYGSWRITKMQFNLKYIDGNMNLPLMAQERLKNQSSLK